MRRIDLNSDLGESFGAWHMGDDQAMLSLVTSANVAGGFHAGDPQGILHTLRLAHAQGVCVGAHVSYRDLQGFGRRHMDVSSADLVADVIYQIAALQGLAQVAGTRIRYVKPHGALYNTIANDRRQALDVIHAIKLIDDRLPLVGLAGSPLLSWAQEHGLSTVAEIFADRAYTVTGALVSRREPGAVLHDAEYVAQRIVRWVQDGYLLSIDGQRTPIQADSVCVHGDSPRAVAMTQAIRDALMAVGIQLHSFTSLD